MAFISNCDRLTLGDGVYNNVHGNIVHNTFYGKKRRREEIDDGSDFASSHPTSRRRREEEDGIKVIRMRNLKLTDEIGNGPGYFLHAGKNKGRAVVVKVFNTGPTAREQLESTVAISKGLMHPNVLRIEGISSLASPTHFIAYESIHWKNVEGPLAAALKDDLMRSVTLGFKMIAGLSSAMNHLRVQGISLASLEVENFDVFLDVDDRFLMSINPRMAPKPSFAHFEEPEDDRSWDVFDGLCQKVLRSANRVLHSEPIDRNPVTLDLLRRPSMPQNPVGPALASLESNDSVRPQNISEEQPPVPPRREYVWRTTDRGQQSLATIANRITLDLDMKLSSLRRLPWSDGQRSHRCAGYVREEITLAITTVDSAVVLRDAPSPLEICSVCHEIVGFDEAFHCVCGDFNPGSRHTVKCQLCKFWSHSDCVGNPKEFRCTRCPPGVTPFIPPLPSPELHSPSFGPYSPRYDASLGPIENMLVGDSTSAGLLSDQAEVPHTDTSSQLEPLSMFDFLDSNVNEGSAVISDTDSALVPTSPFIEPTRLVPGPENPGLFDPRSPREMSWATWQPDPASVPTSPFIEPTRLVPDPESPGLFGPRSPREIRKMPSWETWQPDPTSVPTPPSTEVRLVVPSMFGPRSPGESPYDSIKNLPMEDDSTSAGLFSDQAEVPANSSELEPLSGFDFLDNKMDEGPPDAA